jgi:hypothetical protein
MMNLTNKRIAITSVITNLTYNDRNHRGLEAVFFRKMMEEKGAQVDVIGCKSRNVKDFDFYIDFSNTDFSEYEAVMIQLSAANFFGGQMREHCEKVCNDLAKYKGKIYMLVNDPKIPPINYAKVINKRFGLCTDSIESWDRIIKEATYLFPGKDISKFLGWQPDHWLQVDWFTYIFKHRFAQDDSIDLLTPTRSDIEKEWDLVYYGDKRGVFRETQILNYFPKDTNNLLIGYSSDKVPATFIKKLQHSDLMKKLDRVKVSLITGDEEHLDNVTTYRFYETLASNCLAAIQIEYDPEKRLIQDPVLRDILYVKNQDDVKKLISMWSSELVDLQKKELRRIFGQDFKSQKYRLF